eukprot:scaffold6221_cov104-Phaeocystis_antarctica.AAC.2
MWRETALYVGPGRSRRHRQAARPACLAREGGSGRPLGLRSSPCDARHVSARRVACSRSRRRGSTIV